MASLMSEERRGRGRDWASQGSAPEPGLTKPICLGPDLLPKSGTALEWQDADQALCHVTNNNKKRRDIP